MFLCELHITQSSKLTKKDMKIFQDWKAQKAFTGYYQNLKPELQAQLGDEIRKLAEKKVNSEEGEYEEFYITAKDVVDIYTKITGV